jgi:hypothetical protein
MTLLNKHKLFFVTCYTRKMYFLQHFRLGVCLNEFLTEILVEINVLRCHL